MALQCILFCVGCVHWEWGVQRSGKSFFDLFFKDMDQAMQAGVGDMGVGKKYRKWLRPSMAEQRLMMKCSTQSGDMASGIYDILSRNLYPE